MSSTPEAHDRHTSDALAIAIAGSPGGLREMYAAREALGPQRQQADSAADRGAHTTANRPTRAEDLFDAGMRSDMGKCRPKDYGEAGYSEGQYGLAQCLSFGRGVPRDDNEAARYYRLAADQGHAAAQCCLAQQYLHGGGGLPKDHDEGVRYHRLAADQNHAPSQLALGSMLIDDEHIPADERALEPALANAREGAKLLARATQSTDPNLIPPFASRRSSSSAITPTSARAEQSGEDASQQ
ncbi:hypothetical protein T492DRAFT_872692 [Pavlovales sp. CCMP2436]|nr:hypothetical protein T492DRAFT_872692 [Pavlovales sp. CCMP2436]